MIELCYSSKRIRDLSDVELSKKAKELLLRIHVVTGWTIPDNEILLLLVDEFQKKLVNDYAEINDNEIMQAFRQYGTTLKDWGKNMNLNLIEVVMTQYLNERYRLNMSLEAKVIADNTPKLPAPELTEDEVLESSLDYWKTSSLRKVEFINPACYDILAKSEKIVLTNDEKKRILADAKTIILCYSLAKNEMDKLIEDELYVGNLCKKIAVSEYFNKLIQEEND